MTLESSAALSRHTKRKGHPVLSVVILGWNGRDYVRDCLRSLVDQDLKQPYEVIFVDNGSTDGTPDIVATEFPWVKLHRLPRNTGYCRGNNLGYELARGDAVLFLNQDTVLHGSCLRQLLEGLRADNVGAVHANIIQPWYPEFAGLERRKMPDSAYTADLSPMGFIHYRPIPAEPHTQDTLFLHGVATAVKRGLIDLLGYPFDPDMWAYAEDLDLALRTRAAGFRTLVVTRAVVYHKHTLDTRLTVATFIRTARIIRNRVLAFWKCCYWIEFLPLALVTFACAPLNAKEFGLTWRRALLYGLLLVPPAVVALFMTLWAMPKFGKRRQEVLRRRVVPAGWFLRTIWGRRTALSKAASRFPALRP